MTATVLPFRHARRVYFVARHAEHMAAIDEISAERYLRRQIKIQFETMTRRMIDAERVERECFKLEAAIRQHVARITQARAE